MLSIKGQIAALVFLVIVGYLLVGALTSGNTTLTLIIVLIIGISLGIFLWLRRWVESD